MENKVKQEKKKAEKEEPKTEKKALPFQDPWGILLYPLLTEKVIGKVENENKLVFIVRRDSTKRQIAWSVERIFNVKSEKVQTLIDRRGRKKAFVKLSKGFNAGEIATRLGML